MKRLRPLLHLLLMLSLLTQGLGLRVAVASRCAMPSAAISAASTPMSHCPAHGAQAMAADAGDHPQAQPRKSCCEKASCPHMAACTASVAALPSSASLTAVHGNTLPSAPATIASIRLAPATANFRPPILLPA